MGKKILIWVWLFLYYSAPVLNIYYQMFCIIIKLMSEELKEMFFDETFNINIDISTCKIKDTYLVSLIVYYVPLQDILTPT